MGFIDQVRLVLGNIFDPDNPFIPWLIVLDLVFLLVHLYMVYWVYRDAMARYHRGAPWATLAMVFPFGGWLFYVLYRNSPLVEMDRIEADLFDEDAEEWTDYDAYKAKQGSPMFRELGSILRKPEGEGYSPWVRLSRMRELRRMKTPEERAAQKQQRLLTRKEAVERKRMRREEKAQRRRQSKQDLRERTTLVGAMGATIRMSDRKQRAMQRKLELVEKLKLLPREDKVLEDMIYEMRYADALNAARDGVAVAREAQDPQAEITYQAYVERLERLVAQ
jgi:hypothetical protein